MTPNSCLWPGKRRARLKTDRCIETLDLSGDSTARQVLALQRAAYRVEADLIGFEGIPPLNETLDELVAQPLTWIGVREGDAVIAALGYTVDGSHCDIDRLVVAPEHFGRGLATALVTSLFAYPRITVSTGTANLPARRLYEKHGFRVTGEREIDSGVTVTQYERVCAPTQPRQSR